MNWTQLRRRFGSADMQVFTCFLNPRLDSVLRISIYFYFFICSFMPIIFLFISVYFVSLIITILGSFTTKIFKFSIELCFFLLILLLSSFLAEYCCTLAQLLFLTWLTLFLKRGDSLLSLYSIGFEVAHFLEGLFIGYLSCFLTLFEPRLIVFEKQYCLSNY